MTRPVSLNPDLGTTLAVPIPRTRNTVFFEGWGLGFEIWAAEMPCSLKDRKQPAAGIYWSNLDG